MHRHRHAQNLRRQVILSSSARRGHYRRRHPDRSRFSGGERDLPLKCCTGLGDPSAAKKNTGCRDDALFMRVSAGAFPDTNYSERSACTGSIDAALCAGISPAMQAARANTPTEPRTIPGPALVIS